MPELPEVETVVRQLSPYLLGRQVVSLEILDPKLEQADREAVNGRTVLAVERRGKQILISLSPLAEGGGPLWLGIHLRMTGRLICDSSSAEQNEKHLRARLVLDRGSLLFFDLRRFGLFQILHSPEPARSAGLDPLSPQFTLLRLRELIGTSRQEIKPWLLRQDRLAGIGNIYASEILFAARIDPRRAAVSLSAGETSRLHRAIRRILRLAVEHCGTTFSDFQDSHGRSGSFQHLLAVYGRGGQPCPDCGEPVKRIVQQQRSTFFCPGQQK
jgi:formamidopyrimidine-DNA glycosylase